MSEPWAGRRLHLVGIGGAGMSGLATVARALGASVTGSDRAQSPMLERLRAQGIDAHAGHDAAHVPPDAEVVWSTAVPEDNPERAVARERGQRELHRGELLGELTRLKPTIAVAGAHGKTTTTSMVVHVLDACGLEPSYLIGGDLRSTQTNAEWRAGEWLVVEADESDRSFLALAPRVAVVTNLELDHHTTYPSRLDLEAAFREFVAGAEHAVLWARPEVIALRTGDGVHLFDAAARPHDGGVAFVHGDVEVQLPVPGEHNARNAAAALTAAELAGADPARAAAALADFPGAGRRLEPLGVTAAGARVYDDYAHHPTEVAATIAAARALEPRRLVAVFQPHLYSRTAHLGREFGPALAGADSIVVLDVYPARERPEDFPGVTGKLVADAAADAAGGRPVAWMPDRGAAERLLRGELGEGDLCLTMGAGDVDALGRALVAA